MKWTKHQPLQKGSKMQNPRLNEAARENKIATMKNAKMSKMMIFYNNEHELNKGS